MDAHRKLTGDSDAASSITAIGCNGSSAAFLEQFARIGLSALRSKYPWVGAFGRPKSVSPFMWAAFARERITRASLLALRAKHPWVGVFGPPKSASTFIWAALARMLNAERLMFNIVHPDDPSRQLLHELDWRQMQARERDTRPIVFRLHAMASGNVLTCLDRFCVRSVLCSRNIFDCLVSLREEWIRQWSAPSYVGAFSLGGEDNFIGRLDASQIRRFLAADDQGRMDIIIELTAAWYLRFYSSWKRAIQDQPHAFAIVRYEDLIDREEEMLSRLLEHLGCPHIHKSPAWVVDHLKTNRHESNLNVGLSGRGKALMTGAQVDRVIAIAETLGATELIDGI
jgi:hypothetical protein